jgi:hypothetical protein
MENQMIINALIAGLSAAFGFLLNRMWQAVRDLQNADKEIIKKVNAIEVLVAGDYVKQDKFDSMVDRLFKNLRRIEDKLDAKVDKKAFPGN